MKFSIKKHLEFLICSYTIVTFGYLVICWFNVISHNVITDYVYPEWNLFVTIINHSYADTYHTPTYVTIICVLCIIIIDLVQILWWEYKHPHHNKPTHIKERGTTEWGFYIYHHK